MRYNLLNCLLRGKKLLKSTRGYINYLNNKNRILISSLKRVFVECCLIKSVPTQKIAYMAFSKLNIDREK